MIDLYQLTGWVIFAGLLIAAPMVSVRPVRRFLGPRLIRLGRLALNRLTPEVEIDEEAEAWAAYRRRERLCGHIQRLRRVLATDMSMSATRQIANRLAFASLLRELEHTPVVFPPVFSAILPATPGDSIVNRWSAPAVPISVNMVTVDAPEYAPRVEILELGWRR